MTQCTQIAAGSRDALSRDVGLSSGVDNRIPTEQHTALGAQRSNGALDEACHIPFPETGKSLHGNPETWPATPIRATRRP